MTTPSVRVLVVDDDPALLAMYRDRLFAEGFIVVTATDGQQALAQAIAMKPDILLLDMRMPHVTGLEVLEILKTTKATKDIPVIVLSALGDDNLRQQAMARGAVDYLTKADTTPAQVVEKVRSVLTAHERSAIR